MGDKPIKGPGAEAPTIKAKPLGVRAKQAAIVERFQQAHALPAIVIEETVQAAAVRLGITHELVLRGLLDEAQAPYATSAERTAAWRTLGEWVGTAKAAPTIHNHLHAHLANVPTETLEQRIAKIVGGITG